MSLTVDVGMYWGETLRTQYPHLTWEQVLKNKSFVDYGRAVLLGFGPVPLNPVRVMLAVAYGISGISKSDGRGLAEIYKHWAGKAETAVKGN